MSKTPSDQIMMFCIDTAIKTLVAANKAPTPENVSDAAQKYYKLITVEAANGR